MTNLATTGPRPGRLRVALVLIGAVVGLGLVVSAVAPRIIEEPEATPVGAEILPDLAAAPIIELTAGRGPDGREALFFSAEIANVGEGDFLLRAVQSGFANSWNIRQRIQHATSGYTRIDIPSRMVFAGDAHNHWHVFRAADYKLFRNGEELAADAKVGFCFFDNMHYLPELPGSPAEPVFDKNTCNGRNGAALDMGLSVGWSDRYIWTLPGQNLDITGLPDGRYLVEMTVDPEGWFREVTRANNQSWVEFTLGRAADGLPTVTELSSSPAN